jgi:hypothetical protein
MIGLPRTGRTGAAVDGAIRAALTGYEEEANDAYRSYLKAGLSEPTANLFSNPYGAWLR